VVGFDSFPLLCRKLESDKIIFVNNRKEMNINFDIVSELEREDLKNAKENAILVNDLSAPEISATMIREKINQNKQLDKYLPSSLVDFIKKNKIRFPQEKKPSSKFPEDNFSDEGEGESKEKNIEEDSDQDSEEESVKRRHSTKSKGKNSKETKQKTNKKGSNKDSTSNKSTPEFTGIKKLSEIVNFDYNPIDFADLTYEIKQGTTEKLLLGKGLQAKVYAMMLKQKGGMADLPVAVKIFDLSIQKANKIKAFVYELKSMSKMIEHPNVIKCYGGGTNRMELFLVLEKASSVNMWDYAATHKNQWTNGLPPKLIRAFAGLAEGCASMAKSGVHHRDLQMNNILITFQEDIDKKSNKTAEENDTEERKANEEKLEPKKISPEEEEEEKKLIFKIADFGVSASKEDIEHVIRGSVRHYSPEAIIDKKNYCEKSDVFSFGNLIWEFMHGCLLWKSKRVDEVCLRILKKERPRFKVPCQKELVDVISRCWDHNMETRPDFAEVSRMLNHAYEALNFESK
jgi:hypothetical protein